MTRYFTKKNQLQGLRDPQGSGTPPGPWGPPQVLMNLGPKATFSRFRPWILSGLMLNLGSPPRGSYGSQEIPGGPKILKILRKIIVLRLGGSKNFKILRKTLILMAPGAQGDPRSLKVIQSLCKIFY